MISNFFKRVSSSCISFFDKLKQKTSSFFSNITGNSHKYSKPNEPEEQDSKKDNVKKALTNETEESTNHQQPNIQNIDGKNENIMDFLRSFAGSKGEIKGEYKTPLVTLRNFNVDVTKDSLRISAYGQSKEIKFSALEKNINLLNEKIKEFKIDTKKSYVELDGKKTTFKDFIEQLKEVSQNSQNKALEENNQSRQINQINNQATILSQNENIVDIGNDNMDNAHTNYPFKSEKQTQKIAYLVSFFEDVAEKSAKSIVNLREKGQSFADNSKKIARSTKDKGLYLINIASNLLINESYGSQFKKLDIETEISEDEPSALARKPQIYQFEKENLRLTRY